MFTLPGLFALLAVTYTRAHEISSWLRTLPVMNLIYLVGCFGLLLDIRLGLVRPQACPQLRIVLPLWLWVLLSPVLTGGELAPVATTTAVCLLLFIFVAQGIQSFRALQALTVVVLGFSLFLGTVALVQARSPFECILLAADAPGDDAGLPDGRPCESPVTVEERPSRARTISASGRAPSTPPPSPMDGSGTGVSFRIPTNCHWRWVSHCPLPWPSFSCADPCRACCC